MITFDLTLESGNEAFDASPSEEVARILLETANRLVSHGAMSGQLRDINGNSVGRFVLDVEEAA